MAVQVLTKENGQLVTGRLDAAQQYRTMRGQETFEELMAKVLTARNSSNPAETWRPALEMARKLCREQSPAQPIIAASASRVGSKVGY